MTRDDFDTIDRHPILASPCGIIDGSAVDDGFPPPDDGGFATLPDRRAGPPAPECPAAPGSLRLPSGLAA